MTEDKKNPELIEDAELDETSGGGLLVPAIQKVREAAARSHGAPGGTTTVNEGTLNATPPKP